MNKALSAHKKGVSVRATGEASAAGPRHPTLDRGLSWTDPEASFLLEMDSSVPDASCFLFFTGALAPALLCLITEAVKKDMINPKELV